MPQATTKKRVKPEKPSPDFPLTANPNGQWSKKVKGRVFYFGSWADPKGAMKRWFAQKETIIRTGRKPKQADPNATTIVQLINRFLEVKEDLVQSGEIQRRTWNDYKTACGRLIAAFGRGRLVEDLGPDDFEKLRRKLAKTRKSIALGNEIQRTRTIFKYAWEADLVDRPIKFGPGFKKPSKKSRRRERNAKGELMFSAAEIRAMLREATPQLRAMVLLGLNCGMGNSDVASFPLARLDLDRGWHNYERPKTLVDRRAPLWCETVAALREALDARPTPKALADDGLVFVTKYGRRWVRLNGDSTTWVDSVGLEFGKLLRKLGIKRPGISFYTLRRTFRTVGDEVKDQPAVRYIMGHAADDSDMDETYRQRINDDRLQAVVDHVRDWLFSELDEEV